MSRSTWIVALVVIAVAIVLGVMLWPGASDDVMPASEAPAAEAPASDGDADAPADAEPATE